MPVPVLHRMAVAVDCECGVTVEACDDEELLDELIEHIAALHEEPMRTQPRELVAAASYPV